MDLIRQLGELALGSRFRRLSDRIMQEGALIYGEAAIPFQPRWFPLFFLLKEKETASLTAIARDLGITHSAVHQTAAEMAKNGLIRSLKSKRDKRKRLLALSDEGRRLASHIETVWDDIRGAMREIVEASGFDVLGAIEAMEAAMDRRNLYERFKQRHKQRQRDAVDIIPFQPQYREAFKRLNVAWIAKDFRVEEVDLPILNDPEQNIVAQGGEVFFARDHATGDVLGTCALLNHGNGCFELTKMTVAEEARGRQIGRKLGEAVIQKARALGLAEIFLETNSKLTPALTLYRRLGFTAVPFTTPSEYRRADVRMVLRL